MKSRKRKLEDRCEGSKEEDKGRVDTRPGVVPTFRSKGDTNFLSEEERDRRFL